MLCTGFLSYCGPFNQEFRNQLISAHWMKELRKRQIPYTDKLNLTAMLVDNATVSLMIDVRVVRYFIIYLCVYLGFFIEVFVYMEYAYMYVYISMPSTLLLPQVF